MGDEKLQIVIEAKDEASAQIQTLEARWNEMAAAVAKTGGTVARTRAELDATAASVEELGAATETAGVEAEASGGMFETFGTKAESMFERLAVKATVIGAIIGGFLYLKDALKEAEEANKSYTDKFEKTTDAIEKQKVAIGDDLIPGMIVLEQTWVDLTGANDDANHKMGAFAEIVTTAAKIVATGMVIFDDFGKQLGDLAAVAVADVTDGLRNFGAELGNIAHAMVDLAHGDFAKAWKDISDSSKMSWDGAKYAGVQGVEDARNAAAELDKIWSFKGPDSLSQTPYVKPKKVKDDTKQVAESMQALQDTFSSVAASISSDNESFIATASRDFEAFVTKTTALKAQLASLKADHAERAGGISANTHEAEVKEYEKLQDELKKAQDKQDAYTVHKIQDTLNAHRELEADALKDRNKDTIQAIAEKGAAELAKENEAFVKKQSAVEDAMAKEQQAYDRQEEALVKKVQDTYDKLAETVRKGLEKIQQVKGVTQAQVASATQAASGLLGGIQAAESSSLAAIASPSAAQAAAPVTVNVLSGATVHATTPQGVQELAAQVAAILARTMQSQRSGLATQH